MSSPLRSTGHSKLPTSASRVLDLAVDGHDRTLAVPGVRAHRRTRLRGPSLSARKAGAQECCSSGEAGDQRPQMEVK